MKIKRRPARLLEHERLLFRYTNALERGDFETVAAVLRRAERDPELEARLLDLHEALDAETTHPSPASNRIIRKETTPMTAIAQFQRPHSQSGRFSVAFVAALFAVLALFGAALSTNLNGSGSFLPNGDPNSADSPPLLAPSSEDDEQAQPQPALIPLATATPIPMALPPNPADVRPDASGSFTQAGQTICLLSDIPIPVYSRASTAATTIAILSPNVIFSVNFVIQEPTPNPLSWLNITAVFEEALVSGWLPNSLSLRNAPCPAVVLSMGRVEISPSVSAIQIEIAPTLLPPTLVPSGVTSGTVMVSPPDDIEARLAALEAELRALQEQLAQARNP